MFPLVVPTDYLHLAPKNYNSFYLVFPEFMIVASIRRIFTSFRTEEEERLYSRTAFFNLLGFLGSCVMFSFVAQKLSKQQ